MWKFTYNYIIENKISWAFIKNMCDFDIDLNLAVTVAKYKWQIIPTKMNCDTPSRILILCSLYLVGRFRRNESEKT